MIGNDFIGLAFNVAEWKSLTNTFPHIDDYFGSYSSNYADQQMVGCNFSLRFTTAHSDKAIQIEELLQPSKNGDCAQITPVKKYKRSVIMKRTTFEKLKNITDCVAVKLRYLESIEARVEFFADQLGKHFLGALSQKQEAQYTTISITDILSAEKLAASAFEKIVAKFPTAEMRPLTLDEMNILTEKFILPVLII